MRFVWIASVRHHLAEYAHVEDVSQALFEVAQWPDKFVPEFSRHGRSRERVLNNVRCHWFYVYFWGHVLFQERQPNVELPEWLKQRLLAKRDVVCCIDLAMLALAMNVVPQVGLSISGPAYWLTVMRADSQLGVPVVLGDRHKARLAGRSLAVKNSENFLSELRSHVTDGDEDRVLRMADSDRYAYRTLILTAATIACENEAFDKNVFTPFLRHYRKGLRALKAKGFSFAYADPVHGYTIMKQGRRKE